MGRFAVILVAVAILSAIITYALWRTISNKLIKYLPAILLLFISIYNFYLSRTVQEGFKDIVNILAATMCIVGAISGGITGLLLDYFKNSTYNQTK